MPIALRTYADDEALLPAESSAAPICNCFVCAGVSYDGPQGFAPPTSGTAGNDLPIYSWNQAATQLTRSGASWSGVLGTAATVT